LSSPDAERAPVKTISQRSLCRSRYSHMLSATTSDLSPFLSRVMVVFTVTAASSLQRPSDAATMAAACGGNWGDRIAGSSWRLETRPRASCLASAGGGRGLSLAYPGGGLTGARREG